MHFGGSCCIRIFWHYGQRKKTFPWLILISLLLDESCKGKKGTCPSDLAIVLSGRHNPHLVTLSSMSLALTFFQDPFLFSFTLMHLHNFNICSLMCLSFSNISIGSQWTGPHSLQINKCSHIATVHTTISYFINHHYSMSHTSDCLFLKQLLCHVKQHNRILLSLVF